MGGAEVVRGCVERFAVRAWVSGCVLTVISTACWKSHLHRRERQSRGRALLEVNSGFPTDIGLAG